MIFLLLAFSTALAIWGSQTRGEWSRNMAMLGGAGWSLILVHIFLKIGVKTGLSSLLFSFILGAIFQRIFPKKL